MTGRSSETNVDRLFLDRWSPRAFDGSRLSADERDALFDAARWAPSAFNAQPWRLLYAEQGDADWDRFVGLLLPANQAWAGSSSLLIVFVSETTFKDSPSHTHSFDTGAAWMALALQARALGLYAHAMAGFDQARAYTELGVPEAEYEAMAAIAVGHLGDPATLNDKQRAMEAPNARKPAAGFVHRGRFTKPE